MFSQIVVDPPWPKKKGGSRAARPNQTRELDYKTMSVVEIFALLDRDIFPLCLTPHNVWLWTIDQFLWDAEREMLARGYRLHARLVWNKLNGVAPAFTIRYCHEYILWFYKPKLPKIAVDQRGKFSTIIEEKSRQHSRKPDALYSMVDLLYPDDAKLDVFSREKRCGWEQYGDEVSKFIQGY